jgi:type IV pilus assembly protein PilM
MPQRARNQPATQRALPHAVGLELGSANLKVVELQRGSPPKLTALGMRPTPDGALQDDRIDDPQALAEEIRQLLRDAGVRRRQVLTAVGTKQAVTRTITMPHMSREEVAEAIAWEAERYLPFPMDDVELDHALLDDPDTSAPGASLEVMIAAARKGLLEDQVSTLRLAGLVPVAIDIKPFALLRAIATQAEAGNTGPLATAVIELGASETSLTMVRDGRVLMNRNLGVCGNDFTHALQTALGVAFDEAETLKIGLLANPAGPAMNALTPMLGTLLTEVGRTLEFGQAQHANARVGQILLAGGGAHLAQLPEKLEAATGVPVTLVNPYQHLHIDARHFNLDLLEQLGPAFGVPIGLALRGVGA